MNRAFRRTLLVLLILVMLAACAPAATPTGAPSFTEAPPLATPSPAATLAAEPTEAPAAATSSGAAATSLPPTAAPEVTAAPTQPASEGGTATEPALTAAPQTDARVVELEYPANQRLASSTIVRLSLVPNDNEYQIERELSDGTIITETVTVAAPREYTVFAGAHLLGVNFDIAPAEEEFRRVNPGETITWRWSVRPQTAGDHVLTVNLRLRLVAPDDTREAELFSRAIPVRVWPFPGPTWLFMGLGVLGLVSGGALSLTAFFWRGRRAPRRLPNTTMQLDLPANFGLETSDERLLRTLFSDYQRLIVEREFRSGYSGARALLALPVKADGRADAHTIVKIGPSGDIDREYANYERFVKNTLPPMTARMQDAPLQFNGRAALRYTFIAEAGQRPVSLRQALRQDPDPALLWRLFDTFAPHWWMQTRPMTFRLAAEYDRVLPPQLVVRPLSRPAERADAAAPLLGPDTDLARFKTGDVVRVGRFPMVAPRTDGRSLSLSAPAGPGRSPLRLAWLSPQPPNGSPLLAEVVATRQDYLRERVKDVDLCGVPDPINRLPELLEATVVGGSSIIHGDLNLENALVGPAGLVWLIDFSETREGHVLYDFARLGAELIGHVLAPRAGDPTVFREAWRRDQQDPATLAGTVFAIPRRLRADAQASTEFELCLTVACLGALKHDNLDPLARACLYLAAADLAARRP